VSRPVTGGPITVVVAEDQALLRGTFRMLIDSAPGLTTVGEASTGAEAVDISCREQPDLVLMDIRMPELDGIEATRQICGAAVTADVRVVILTTYDLDEYVYAALRAGASGFLLKHTRPRDLLHAIEVVAAGEALIAPGITRRLIAEFAARRDPTQPPAALTELTQREREILRLIARGQSNAEIAEHLVISPLTAKTHVRNVLRKLDCRDRAALVALAYETGLVTPGQTD
jgi:DNA-binding NarL/FixJ family response regulator